VPRTTSIGIYASRRVGFTILSAKSAVIPAGLTKSSFLWLNSKDLPAFSTYIHVYCVRPIESPSPDMHTVNICWDDVASRRPRDEAVVSLGRLGTAPSPPSLAGSLSQFSATMKASRFNRQKFYTKIGRASCRERV